MLWGRGASRSLRSFPPGAVTRPPSPALRMSVDAFKACRARQPRWRRRISGAWAPEHDALVSNLRAAADTGNVVANIFLLKARHAYRGGAA